jgi:hypothetical protein
VCGSALARKAATIWSYLVCALDQKLPGNKKSSTHGAGAMHWRLGYFELEVISSYVFNALGQIV